MSDLPPQATLPELQEYVARTCRSRGWDQASDLETFLLFVEEVGELARAFRDHRDLFQEAGRPRGRVAEELADVLSYLLDLSNRLGVDLETAFRAKEERNQGRTWT
jgi:NTP pyrophosphatase (non-canonical NTP hydrolase)